MNNKLNFWAAGKLLLFGEYLVLKGANSLAIPSNFGQSLKIEKCNNNYFHWNSFANGQKWLDIKFNSELSIIDSDQPEKAKKLIQLLRFILDNSPRVLEIPLSFSTDTNFPREWGLGTSSTLVSLLSQWSGVQPFELLKCTFGGSGYDVACATAKTPILYQINGNKVVPTLIHRPIISKILFVYSGKKQDSQQEVAKFNHATVANDAIERMNEVVNQVILTNNIEEFENAMLESEQIIGEILHREPLKERFFSDYPYAIKSLGAWGGDFFMATFREEEEARFYFLNKGYVVQFNYWEFIRQ